MIKEKLIILADYLYQLYWDKKTELYYTNNYQLLIAILMSAQSSDQQVNKVNYEFFKILKTPSDALKLWIEWIEKFIKAIWLYKTKAKNIYYLSKIVSKNWIPNNLNELIKLPWVWIKTAKVYLSVAFNMPYVPIDRHAHRVLSRYIFNTKNPIETDKLLQNYLTDNIAYKLQHSLVYFWREYCKSKKPLCEKCNVNKFCKYYTK